VYGWVAGFSPQIKDSLMNNIILLKKEDTFNHMRGCIKTGCLGCELLDMTHSIFTTGPEY
jgi:hypothetical protein